MTDRDSQASEAEYRRDYLRQQRQIGRGVDRLPPDETDDTPTAGLTETEQRRAARELTKVRQRFGSAPAPTPKEVEAVDAALRSVEPRSAPTTKLADERRFARHLNILQRAARVGRLGAQFAGAPDLAEALSGVEGIGRESEEATRARAGFVHSFSSNVAGRRAAQFAERQLGMAGGRAAAVGGAIAGAFGQVGVGSIAVNAARWYARKVAFGALLAPPTFIPALLYLNVDFLVAAMNANPLAKFFIWEKLILFLVDLLALVIAILLLVFMAAIFDAVSGESSFSEREGSIPIHVK